MSSFVRPRSLSLCSAISFSRNFWIFPLPVIGHSSADYHSPLFSAHPSPFSISNEMIQRPWNEASLSANQRKKPRVRGFHFFRISPHIALHAAMYPNKKGANQRTGAPSSIPLPIISASQVPFYTTRPSKRQCRTRPAILQQNPRSAKQIAGSARKPNWRANLLSWLVWR